jgi:isopenicillin N synthase-like dioxygenase
MDMTTKLRLVLYPDQLEQPLPGQLRNAAHTDFNGFTLLRQDNAPGLGVNAEISSSVGQTIAGARTCTG